MLLSRVDCVNLACTHWLLHWWIYLKGKNPKGWWANCVFLLANLKSISRNYTACQVIKHTTGTQLNWAKVIQSLKLNKPAKHYLTTVYSLHPHFLYRHSFPTSRFNISTHSFLMPIHEVHLSVHLPSNRQSSHSSRCHSTPSTHALVTTLFSSLLHIQSRINK